MYSGLGLPSPRQNSCTESPSRTQPSVVAGLPTQNCTCSVGSKGKGGRGRGAYGQGQGQVKGKRQGWVEGQRLWPQHRGGLWLLEG